MRHKNTPTTSPAKKRDHLFEMASGQFGLFTAKQAIRAGYNRKHFHTFVESGEWSHELLGLFRLVNYPSAPEQEYMKWLLWSRNRADKIQGCLSYETALYVYKLGDLMPNQIHMTVPRDFRRNGEAPIILQLHQENLRAESIQLENGLLLTTPTKTLEDLIRDGRTDKTTLEDSLTKAVEMGIITRKQMSESEALQSLSN
ncbi:MAG: type IV toxin-antitoxin system AbiEi family antitoxin domain-containing protein [Candidatus Obscuribacterales bacterium]|jgi:predicted transcriptional regulator of viral defense system